MLKRFYWLFKSIGPKVRVEGNDKFEVLNFGENSVVKVCIGND
jgi:hypothetical protein